MDKLFDASLHLIAPAIFTGLFWLGCDKVCRAIIDLRETVLRLTQTVLIAPAADTSDLGRSWRKGQDMLHLRPGEYLDTSIVTRSINEWWAACLKGEHRIETDFDAWIPVEDLLMSYRVFCSENKIPFPHREIFFAEFRRLVPLARAGKCISDGKRVNAFYIPKPEGFAAKANGVRDDAEESLQP